MNRGKNLQQKIKIAQYLIHKKNICLLFILYPLKKTSYLGLNILGNIDRHTVRKLPFLGL